MNFLAADPNAGHEENEKFYFQTDVFAMTVVAELLKRSCLSLSSLKQAPDRDCVRLGDVTSWGGGRKSETRNNRRPMSRCISEVTAMSNQSDYPRASHNCPPKEGGSIIYPLVSSPPRLNVATVSVSVHGVPKHS